MVKLTKQLQDTINQAGGTIGFLESIKKDLWLDDKGNLCYLNMLMFKLKRIKGM